MPFLVNTAAAHETRCVVHFPQYNQKVILFYNTGEKYRAFQLKAQALDQEMSNLQRRLSALREDASPEEGDKLYKELEVAMATARRRIADNICEVISSWDLEAKEPITLDFLKARMSKEDQKRFKDIEGEGEIPVDGAWLDATPLPDEFILTFVEAITEDFNKGRAGGKALSPVT